MKLLSVTGTIDTLNVLTYSPMKEAKIIETETNSAYKKNKEAVYMLCL